MTSFTKPAHRVHKTFLQRHPSVLLLAFVLCVVAALSIWIFRIERTQLQRAYEQQLVAAEEKVIWISARLVNQVQLASLTLDRELFLSRLLDLEGDFNREAIERLFVDFIQDQPLISQIRWLDTGGMERARIDRYSGENGKDVFQPAETLQEKSQRDYFREASKLDPGQFYNSIMTLNREFGEITLPHQPTIRAATKTHRGLNMLDGVLVINFDLTTVIEDYRSISDVTGTHVNIFDVSNGHVYLSTQHPDLEFSHELEHPTRSFWDLYPERRQRLLELVESDQLVYKSPFEITIRYPAAQSIPGTARSPRVWSRGARLNVSEGELLFDLTIPPAHIAADDRNLAAVLGLSFTIVALVVGMFALATFRLEQRNLRALREAENLAAVKSQFLANMSHEIRTPVTGITGMLDLIDINSESQDNREKIQFVKRCTNALRQIIDDILDTTKLQSGKVELDPAPFRPSATLARVIELYSPVAREKSNVLKTSVPEQLVNLVVEGDEFRLEQILNNLVSNAIKFTESGQVTLQLAEKSRDESQVALSFSVIDTGIGIDPKLIRRLGEPFTQADISTTREFGGTGLGLSICNSLLTLMHSSLEISSTPGSGTKVSFDLELPITTAKPETSPGPAVDQETPEPDSSLNETEAMQDRLRAYVKQYGPPRVLVVEDSLSMQMLIEAIFQSLDMPVTLAEHGGIAVQLLEEQEFDIVLMDLQMPEMGGVEATARIRANEKLRQLPIIVLSASVQEEEIQSAIAAGANVCLAKPIDVRALVTRLLEYWRPWDR